LLALAFDDLDTIQQRLKLFDNFEGLLERPIIQAELEKKHRALLQQYQADLSEVEAAFIENRDKVDQGFDDAPIYANMPPIAGSIYWARSSRHRVDEPMVKLVFYNHTSGKRLRSSGRWTSNMRTLSRCWRSTSASGTRTGSPLPWRWPRTS
jgi:dynein heavy chain